MLPRYVMAFQSLRDVIDRGVELTHHEAVAIAQQLITSLDADVPPGPPGPRSPDTLGAPSPDRLDTPSPDNVRLCPDGSVTCCARARPSVLEIAMLLEAMLPRGGPTRVPGALRYAIACALGEVDAPPFGSLADLSAALMRQEEGDRAEVVRDLYARATATRPRVVPLHRERRRHAPSVAELRRQLREADLELFLLANATMRTGSGGVRGQAPDSRREPPRKAGSWDRGRRTRTRTRIRTRTGTLAEVLVAGSALVGVLAAGVTTARRSAADTGFVLPPLPHSPWSVTHAEVRAASVVEPRRTDLTGVVGVPGGLPSKALVTKAGHDPVSLRTPRADVSSVEHEIQSARKADESSVEHEIQGARKKLDLKLYDQALVTLHDVVARRPDAAAYFLIASVQEAQGRFDNALATYRDIARRFPNHARAPEAVFCMARCILQSQRSSKTIEARTLLGEVAAKYSGSPWAPRALIARGDLEERDRLSQRDNILGTLVPAALVTYRQVVREYPASPERATALWKLGQLYETDRRYDRAAETFTELAQEYPGSEYDAWFRAAEIHDRRLKNRGRARATYQRVPPLSPHFNEAQKRLRELSSAPVDSRAPRAPATG